MLKILKLIAAVILFAAAILLFSADSSAADFGTDELYEVLPEESREYLEENNITPENNGFSDMSITDIINDIVNIVTDNIEKPGRMLISLIGVILLTTLFSALRGDSVNKSYDKALSLVSNLCVTIIVSVYLSESLTLISSVLSSSSNFMLTYIPILAGVMAAEGQASSATVFSSVMMIAIELMSQAATGILLPFLSTVLGISAAGGINPDLKLEKLTDGIKKVSIWLLGLIMTLFIGILSLQSSISVSTDSIALKAVRFAVSSSVPFVGGAVSDALATVKTSVQLIKSGIGSFGIIAGASILLPTLINTLIYKFFLFIGKTIGDIFGNDNVTNMIKSGENVMSIILAIISCFFVFVTVSTALVLIICRS